MQTLGLAGVLDDQGLDGFDDLVLLAAGQSSDLLEDLAEPGAPWEAVNPKLAMTVPTGILCPSVTALARSRM